ncbi:MAG: nucleotidyltransferase, partial [Syntrophomonadaceae bacterium]
MMGSGTDLAEKFRLFINNLKIDNPEVISRRYREIGQILNLRYWNIRSDTRNLHYLGSYGRETAVKGLTNINVLFLLPYQVYQEYDKRMGNVQESLLNEVRDVLSKTHSDAFINEEKSLLIPFQDGIKIEIIPGFIGPRKNHIIYPDAQEGQWQTFNPIREIEVINEYNYKYGGKVRHLARMTRAWKMVHEVPIPGMLIDTLVMIFMDEWEGNQSSFSYYGEMVMDFMEYLAGLKNEQLHWYAKG